MSTKMFSNISGDFSGGLSTAMMAIPGSIIFGLLAFAPLGSEYMGQGILSGIYAAVFAGFFTAIFGGTRIMICGPRAPAALVFASVIAQLMATGYFSGTEANMSAILTLGFTMVLLSGIFQMLFGVFQIGKLVKYISFPVIAGIMNGTFLTIITNAVWNYFGITKQGFWELISNIDNLKQFKPLVFLIALTTTILWMTSKKYFSKIPGSVLALAGGSALYYGLSALGYSSGIGETLGAVVPSAYPYPKYLFQFYHVLSDQTYWRFLPMVITGALTIAILNSIESLLVMLAVQNLTQKRASGTRELIVQGIGNTINSLFGAIPGGELQAG